MERSDSGSPLFRSSHFYVEHWQSYEWFSEEKNLKDLKDE